MSMNTTVFVDGLGPQLTNERLQAFFHPYGSLRVIMATSKAGTAEAELMSRGSADSEACEVQDKIIAKQK